jgi:Cu-Zn family superoxide dismutase
MKAVLPLLALLLLAGCGTPRINTMEGLMGYARLQTPTGVAAGGEGLVLFVREGGTLRVTGRVAGLTPGEHGFHVHEHGDCDPGDTDGDGLEEAAGDAGGHFNPTGAPHGPRTGSRGQRHAGDFGNVTADAEGVARIAFNDSLVALTGPRNLIGRALMVHSGRDDLTTQPSGNAGTRIACGVIVSGTTADLERLTAELGAMDAATDG